MQPVDTPKIATGIERVDAIFQVLRPRESTVENTRQY